MTNHGTLEKNLIKFQKHSKAKGKTLSLELRGKILFGLIRPALLVLLRNHSHVIFHRQKTSQQVARVCRRK